MFSLTLAALTSVSAGWLAWRLWVTISPAKSLAGIPLVEFNGDNSRQRYTREVAILLKQGYEKHIKNGEPFCIRDFLNPDRSRVYLPLRYMEEVRNADQEKLSLPAVLDNTSTMSKVGGPRITNEIQVSARVDLSRALNSFIEPMQVHCFQAAKRDLPATQDWTPIVLYPKILESFSQMSARVMVGSGLCEQWPAVSMKYISRVLAAQAAIRMLKARQTALASNADSTEKHNDFIQWIMQNYRANGKIVTSEETVQNIFIVMFASMHGTSFIALQTLFGIIGTSGVLAEVREEISHVKKEELHGTPVWTRSALGKLRTLDSYMKETLRMRPFQDATAHRVAMKSYSFKDGLRVPASTVVSFPNLNYNNNSDVLAPAASSFDGMRCSRKRREEFDASKFQFASTTEHSFDWGAGLHACPGRFMADITIKLVLISLVEKYDMKLDEDGPDRPVENTRFSDGSPDTSMPILVRDLSSNN